MDTLIAKAIFIYETENRGLPVPEDTLDTITWLIRSKVEQEGIKEAEKYIRKGLWEDIIRKRDNEAFNQS